MAEPVRYIVVTEKSAISVVADSVVVKEGILTLSLKDKSGASHMQYMFAKNQWCYIERRPI